MFRLRPFTSTRVRALQKMPKAYLWDWSVVPSDGARFENLVAAHLLKLCHLLVTGPFLDHRGWRAGAIREYAWAAGYAIVHGVIDKNTVPPDVLEHCRGVTEFISERKDE